MTDARDDDETDPGRRTFVTVAAVALAALVAVPGLASAADGGVATGEDPTTVCVWASHGGQQHEVCVRGEQGRGICGYLRVDGRWRDNCRRTWCKIFNCYTNEE